MSDKIRELAEKLIWPDGLMNEKVNSFERILRAELKPLLDAAGDSYKKFLAHHNSEQGGGYNDMGDALMVLAAEVKRWEKP